jgi:hypothetical protein
MRTSLVFLAAVLLASTAHGASPSPPTANSLVIVACKVTDWTNKRPLPDIVRETARGWRDLELYVNENQEYECKREVLENLEDATSYSEDATADHIPITPDFTDQTQCVRAGVTKAQAWNEQHVGNVEDDRIDNDGWAVVGIGCPTPWMSDNGTPDDTSDDKPTGSVKLPDCPSFLPGTNNRMKCVFDESAV